MIAPVQPIAFTRFVRHPGSTEVELRHVVDQGGGERTFFSRDRQFLICTTWTGTLWHRRTERQLRAGDVVEAAPGELLVARRGVGELYCVTIAEAAFVRARQRLDASIVRSSATSFFGAEPAGAAAYLYEALTEPSDVRDLDAHVERIVNAVAARRSSFAERPVVPWDDTLALLHRIGLLDETPFDLTTLSEYWGRSRFSALRTFKRRFGLPPLSYQIHLRVEQAQMALRAGRRPARVAAECGFFDQSHLTRHFKRILGVTPSQYARSAECRARGVRRSTPDSNWAHTVAA